MVLSNRANAFKNYKVMNDIQKAVQLSLHNQLIEHYETIIKYSESNKIATDSFHEKAYYSELIRQARAELSKLQTL